MSEKSYDKEISELKERVIRLEIQLAELNKRVESLSNYSRQLFEYLSRK
jgi:predicted  nucleic acid-binding Zn-ribbon protein